MRLLSNSFVSRQELIEYVKELCPWAEGAVSNIVGGTTEAEARLSEIAPIEYARSRNFGDGHVTKLSPYIRHGIVTLNEVRNRALELCNEPVQITKFIQELAWRDFWHRVLANHPEWSWQDIEPYKTGYKASDYSDILPKDIEEGKTGVACLDAFIDELLRTGYIHNHARMYLASYVVHFRRVKWQAGASWFLKHLLDGDVASNNLSWQWVASTFSSKPYIFNLENVAKYFSKSVDVSSANNQAIDSSYEQLNQRLFIGNGIMI
jgi:deoxyribodipyrimidine photo-lyase